MAAAIERVIIETRQYAKRQRTWFRHQLPEDAVTRVNPLDRDAIRQAQQWWNNIGAAPAASSQSG
jgi:tRNA dimethylallyltransferase